MRPAIRNAILFLPLLIEQKCSLSVIFINPSVAVKVYMWKWCPDYIRNFTKQKRQALEDLNSSQLTSDISLVPSDYLCNQRGKDGLSREQLAHLWSGLPTTTQRSWRNYINDVPEGSQGKTRCKKLTSSKLLSSHPVGFMNNILERDPNPLYFCFPRFLLDLVYGWETTVKRKGCFMCARAAWRSLESHCSLTFLLEELIVMKFLWGKS